MSTLMIGGHSAMAGGTIPQAAFVKQDPTTDGQVLVCGVGDESLGISQRFGNAPSYDYVGTIPPAAVKGQELTFYVPGVPCQLTCGTSWTRGQYLKPDANGFGAPVTTSGDIAGAKAQTNCNAGELGQVDPIRYVKP